MRCESGPMRLVTSPEETRAVGATRSSLRYVAPTTAARSLRPLLPGLAVVLGMLLANRAIATATFRCQQVLLVARDL